MYRAGGGGQSLPLTPSLPTPSLSPNTTFTAFCLPPASALVGEKSSCGYSCFVPGSRQDWWKRRWTRNFGKTVSDSYLRLCCCDLGCGGGGERRQKLQEVCWSGGPTGGTAPIWGPRGSLLKQEGRWECYSKYIEKNYFSYFISTQVTNRCHLAMTVLNYCQTARVAR